MTHPAQKLFLSAARFVASLVRTASPQIQASHVFHDDLQLAHLPSDWILEGSPQPKVKFIAASGDGALNTALWECSAGKFKWQFFCDEVVHILDGEVRVSEEDGSNERVLKPGDVAYFHVGMITIWEVKTFVRKLAVMRDNTAPLALRAQRKIDSILQTG